MTWRLRRRSFVGVAGVSLWHLLAGSEPAVRRAGTTGDWPSYGYGSQNRGVNPGVSGPKSNVSRTWRAELGDSVGRQPAVVGGTAYLVARDDVLYAVGGDGTRQWTVSLSSASHSTPTVAGGTVYVGDDDQAVAIDAADGSEQWRTQIGFYTATYSCAPTVADGTLYLGSAKVNALDVNDGSILWQRENVDVVPDYPPAVAGGTCYVLGDDGEVDGLLALDAGDGSKSWGFGFNAGRTAPVLAGGSVYLGGVGEAYRLDAGNGSVVWSRTLGSNSNAMGPMAVADGVLFVGFDDLYALDAADGSTLWSRDLAGSTASGAVVADGVVYSESGGVYYAHDAATGDRLWSFDSGAATGTPPVVLDGRVQAVTSPYNSPTYLHAIDGDTSSGGGGDGNGGDSNESPTAVFDVLTDSPEAGQSIEFDGSGSSDSDGSVASYEWQFGDDGTATGESVTHTYEDPGTYTVSLTVTDDDGGSDETTAELDVDVAGTTAAIDQGRRIDDVSATELSHGPAVESTVGSVNQALHDGRVDADAAWNAVDRVQLAQDVSADVLEYVGPAHDPLIDEDRYDLARDTAEVAISTGIDVLLQKLSLAERAKERLGAADWLVEGAVTALEDAFTFVMGTLLGDARDRDGTSAKGTAERRCNEVAENVFAKVVDGTLTTAEEVSTAVDEAMSTVTETVANVFRGYVERAAYPGEGWIDAVDGTLERLTDELDGDAVADGLAGTQGAARDAKETAVGEISGTVHFADDKIETLTTRFGELNVADAVLDVAREDPSSIPINAIEALVSIALGFGDTLADVFSSAGDALSAGIGFGAMHRITRLNSRAQRAVVAGTGFREVSR